MLNEQKPNLCVDGRRLVEGTGVATYAAALADAQRTMDVTSCILTSVPAGEGRWARLLRAALPLPMSVSDSRRSLFTAPDAFRVAQVAFDLRGTLLPVRLPGRPGIMHWSYPLPLRAKGWRNVYTIHDLIPLLQPELTPVAAARHRRLLRAVVASADLIVTVSETSRREIVETLGYASDRVVNCGQAIASGAVPARSSADGHLLVLGSVEPRKNVARIIAAYKRSGVSLPLVIAGPDGWQAGSILAEARQVPGVVRLPWLPDSERHALLMGARALLMPSLAEGFGLPVVEAMAAGVPALCSHRGALAEIAGGAALLVDPLNIDAIADGICRIVTDETLRAELIARGRANARRFTPAVFAARLAEAYTGLVAGGADAAYPLPASG